MITLYEAATKAMNEQDSIRKTLVQRIFEEDKHTVPCEQLDGISATLANAAALFYVADRLEAIEEAIKMLDTTIFEKE